MELIAVQPTATCLKSSSKRRNADGDAVNCPQDALLTAPDASGCSSGIKVVGSTELKDVSKPADRNSVADGLSSGSFSTGKSSPSPSIESKIRRKREMESTPPPVKKLKRTTTTTTEIRRNFPSAKMPPMEEIESFFSASELFEKKRFSEKYNFDVTKDVPMEGRYQWVQIKQ